MSAETESVDELWERLSRLEDRVADLRHTVGLQADMLRDRREFVQDWALRQDGTFIRRPPAQLEALL